VPRPVRAPRPYSERQTLKKHVRALRERHNITQQTLAERAGLHVSYVNQIENARRDPSLSSLQKLAVALNVPLSELLAVELTPRDAHGAALEAIAAALAPVPDDRLADVVAIVLAVSNLTHRPR